MSKHANMRIYISILYIAILSYFFRLLPFIFVLFVWKGEGAAHKSVTHERPSDCIRHLEAEWHHSCSLYMPVYVWLLENPANKHLAHEGHSTDTSRNYALAELGAKNAIYIS